MIVINPNSYTAMAMYSLPELLLCIQIHYNFKIPFANNNKFSEIF